MRERKKRLLRQQLSDTATRLFVDHGFDAVRVADIAAECGVSEATVFNYFPTKESLVLDRLEVTLAACRRDSLRPDEARSKLRLQMLAQELEFMTDLLSGSGRPSNSGFGSIAIWRSDPIDAVTARLPQRHDRSVRGGRRRRPGHSRRMQPRGSRAADRGQGDTSACGRCKPKACASTYGSAALDRIQQNVTSDVRRAAELISTGLSTYGLRS